MFRIAKQMVACTALAMLAPAASAALQQVSGLVTDMRIEGGWGFIGYATTMGGTPACGNRVWVDMSSPVGRAVYATALSALNTKLPVVIRADDTSTRVFGACNLYDIYTASQ